MEAKCAHCKRRLEYGVDVIGIQEGVLGPRGMVELEEMEFYCSEECVKNEYDHVDLLQVDRRIP